MGVEPACARPSVRACARPSTLSDMNISATSKPIAINFHLKHHLGGVKAALGFGQDRIRTLFSMATCSSYSIIMGKTVWPLFILAGNDDMHESSEEFEIRRNSTTDCGVSCPLAPEKNPHTLIMGKNSVATFSRLFLIGSYSYLQVTMA